MKKFLMLFIAGALFGCSPNSENGNTSSTDPILGKWTLYKEVYYNTTNNTTTERLADECENISFQEFKSNNIILTTSYGKNGTTNCVLEPNNWEYTKWENIGNNNYKFISKISGQNEEIDTRNVEFQNSNTMIIKSNSNGINNGQPFNYSKEYYTKK